MKLLTVIYSDIPPAGIFVIYRGVKDAATQLANELDVIKQPPELNEREIRRTRDDL